ncbi:MAG: hypothetical protein HYR62_09600 [Actinobacteria bacterium]|nr:hypothetical protein [Actinomycetota bacterium]MBI3687991.1 hypothetical protein [Actinomycetota bacterium]
MSGRTRGTLVGLIAAVATAGLMAWAIVGVLGLAGRVDLPATPPLARCEAVGTAYVVRPEQAGNAATIVAVAVRRGLSPRAAEIALAAALQESKLVNLDFGDRDSLGLFQQRPSQGWGTPTQVLQPRYAAGKFYDTLVRIPNWQRLPLTEVAQRVQQSGYPDAYARWEPEAIALVRALTGKVAAGLSCRFRPDDRPAELADGSGLTARARAALAAATTELGVRRTGMTGLAGAAEGRTFGLQPAGWFVASSLVAHAMELEIRQIGYAGRVWTPDTGWRPEADPPAGPAKGTRTAPTDRIAVTVG